MVIRRRRGCSGPLALLVSALACVLIVACVGGGVYAIFGVLRGSDVVQEALVRAERDFRVTDALGAPLEPGWWVTGSLNTGNGSGSADLTLPISGPRGSGRMIIRAFRQGGEWEYTRLEVELDGGGRINLLR